MEFVGHLIVTGELECLTGFATRGEHPASRVAGVDLPVLRDPITREPYIPGSLFKGKLRYLLEHLHADRVVSDPRDTNNKDGICRCGKKDCPICPLFGVEHQGSAIDLGCRPARLRFLDLLPTKETRDRWRAAQETLGDFTQLKAENAVDRVSLAANPRLIERVPPGARFSYEIQMGLYRFSQSDDPLADLDKLPALQTALRLLTDDTLGGHGSRGYGKVRLCPGKAHFVGQQDYVQRGQRLLQGGSLSGATTEHEECTADLTGRRLTEDLRAFIEKQQRVELSVVEPPSVKRQDSSPLPFDTYLVTFRPYHTLVAEPLHSDTFFGALAWALRVVHGVQGPALVDHLLAEDEIAFSSVFPFVRNARSRLFFFPRPLAAPPPLKENDTARKDFAGWEFASLTVFKELINGQVTEAEIRERFCTLSSAEVIESADPKKPYICLDKKFLLTRDDFRLCQEIWRHDPDRKEQRPLFAETDLTRTRIDRHSGGAAEGRLFFSQESLTTTNSSGYFFLIRARQDTWTEWRSLLATALAFLADRGLGGDLSAGRGKLQDVKLEPFSDLPEPRNPERFVTLSLYSPAPGEISSLHDCWYRLLPRKGKIEMTYLTKRQPFKTRVQMFAEGSTFPLPPGRDVRGIRGDHPIVQKGINENDVETDFTIRQWGRPLAVGMKGRR
jgi:CRISPR-associated protein Csm3